MFTLVGAYPHNLILQRHAKRISQYLDETLEQGTPIRFHITGCPNSCGRLQIADIGLRGSLSRIDEHIVEGFELLIGGTLGLNQTLA